MKFKKNILLLMMLTLSAPSFASGDDEIITLEEKETRQIDNYLDEFMHSLSIATTIGGIALLTDHLLVELDINPWEESALEKCSSFFKNSVYSLINRIKS